MWRALIYGCIPVTYFRAVELPFMRRLGIDYGQFSVNIQPDDYDTTQVRRPSSTLVPPAYGRFYCLSITCSHKHPARWQLHYVGPHAIAPAAIHELSPCTLAVS